jgi:hypothetical protein
MSKQPRDDGNATIPVLGLRPGGGQAIATSTAAARSAAIAGSVRVITLYSTVDCFIETGDSSVEANTSTSHFLPAQIPYDISLGSETIASDNDRFISAILAAGSGILYVSERD